MRSFLIISTISLLALSGLFPQSIPVASGDDVSHLFFIERSKNKNLVQYDIHRMEKSDAPDTKPVNAYWVLENGRREELSPIEREYAYGIVRQERLDGDKYKVVLAGLKQVEIIIEKMKDSYKAVVSINGKESILERIYIGSEEKRGGLPKILYIDLFGRTRETGSPIRERIAPKSPTKIHP